MASKKTKLMINTHVKSSKAWLIAIIAVAILIVVGVLMNMYGGFTKTLVAPKLPTSTIPSSNATIGKCLVEAWSESSTPPSATVPKPQCFEITSAECGKKEAPSPWLTRITWNPQAKCDRT